MESVCEKLQLIGLFLGCLWPKLYKGENPTAPINTGLFRFHLLKGLNLDIIAFMKSCPKYSLNTWDAQWHVSVVETRLSGFSCFSKSTGSQAPSGLAPSRDQLSPGGLAGKSHLSGFLHHVAEAEPSSSHQPGVCKSHDHFLLSGVCKLPGFAFAFTFDSAFPCTPHPHV